LSKQTGDLVHIPRRPLSPIPEQKAMLPFPQDKASVPTSGSRKSTDDPIQAQSQISHPQDQTQVQEQATQVKVPLPPIQQHTPQLAISMSALPSPTPLLYYRLNPSRRGRQMNHSAVVTKKSPYKRRRSGCGCALGCLTVLILLIVIVGAGWFFAIRPQVSPMVMSQLDQALTTAVNQLPAGNSTKLPNTVMIQDTTINNLIVLNLAPSNPVKNPQTV